jgi:methylphosphotriester-DNA--protein-cysteine methyltransferase
MMSTTIEQVQRGLLLTAWSERETVAAFAARLGLTERTLHHVCRQHYGVSPSELLRQQRLRRAYADLANPTAAETVTSTAMRHSFTQLGRFAAAYRELIGERPIDTLRRGRREGQGGAPRPNADSLGAPSANAA